MRKEIETRTVREVMTRHPVTVRPETSIAELKALFETHDFNMFPVVDTQGVLRGIVTKLDLLRTFRPQLRRWIPDLRVLWAERVEGIMNRGGDHRRTRRLDRRRRGYDARVTTAQSAGRRAPRRPVHAGRRRDPHRCSAVLDGGGER